MRSSGKLPCVECGAQLEFSPGEAKLVCPYCGTVNDLPPLDAEGNETTPSPWASAPEPIAELDLRAALNDISGAATTAEVTTVRCGSCGAEVTLDEGTLADECPFCAAALSKDAEHTERYPKPQGVLPFALTEREARQRMKDWLGSRWFAPSSLKKFAEANRPIQGVYIPHYTYDADGHARYSGQRGDAYYVTQWVTVTEDGKSKRVQRQVRKIRWTPVRGAVSRHFDDVLVPASETLGELASDAEATGTRWDLQALEPFRGEYLAGFRAEAPSLKLDTGFERAATAMESVLRGDARRDIGGDEQRVTSLSARFERVTFKHVLLPVWLAAYRWQNKPFRVIVNGRTGHVTGERPYSWLKIGLAVLAVVIVIGAIVVFTQQPPR